VVYYADNNKGLLTFGQMTKGHQGAAGVFWEESGFNPWSCVYGSWRGVRAEFLYPG
jgi:hypothetical protein